MVVNVGYLGGDGIVVTQRTIEWNDGIRLGEC
jgi:hypothetical protein